MVRCWRMPHSRSVRPHGWGVHTHLRKAKRRPAPGAPAVGQNGKVGLLEIYDLTPADGGRLINLSTREFDLLAALARDLVRALADARRGPRFEQDYRSGV